MYINFGGYMHKKWFIGLKRYALFIVLLVAALAIRIMSNYPAVIERYYSNGIYPPLATFLRILLGWLPFSLGDVLYTITGLLLVYTVVVVIRLLITRKLNRTMVKAGIMRSILVILLVYIYFNLSWGLNYNRLGIAHQLKIHPQEYSREDLKMITSVLLNKLNDTRSVMPDSIISIPPYSTVFDSSKAAFRKAAVKYPWLQYQEQSIKRSLYGRMGRYLGFLGYYNPFTGEAQLNLTIPKFMIPYITCHEMGHQLGYASESEASFVGYLAATNSGNRLYKYSAYFDLFSYANRELSRWDTTSAKNNFSRLNNHVKGDFYQLRDYLQKAKNPFEPLVKAFYDQYLKVNQQEKGMESYNQVVGWLIAYKKKHGTI